jgi:hypothetical protein
MEKSANTPVFPKAVTPFSSDSLNAASMAENPSFPAFSIAAFFAVSSCCFWVAIFLAISWTCSCF